MWILMPYCTRQSTRTRICCVPYVSVLVCLIVVHKRVQLVERQTWSPRQNQPSLDLNSGNRVPAGTHASNIFSAPVHQFLSGSPLVVSMSKLHHGVAIPAFPLSSPVVKIQQLRASGHLHNLFIASLVPRQTPCEDSAASRSRHDNSALQFCLSAF